MPRLRSCAPFLLLLVLLAAGCTASSREAEPIRWDRWSDSVFERARREHRFVLLDLEAVWCHWCHVMEETTYRDPDVAALVADHYVAVKVDQDSRPELSNRYEDYGWPATVVFSADGSEIEKRSGYIPPKPMASLLRAIVEDPTPGPSVTATPAPASQPTTAGALEEAFRASYDFERGGWGTVHKYIDGPSVELAIARALGGDAESERMARRTLDAGLALIDPVWGGLYQYSAGSVWTEPHFEKILSFQADGMAAYARAFAAWEVPAYEKAAQDIHRFLRTFLTSPEGAFFVSQDADVVQGEHAAEYFALSDAQRRARGIPRVDTHRYARENGWAIRALATLYACTGDETALAEAIRAAQWVEAHRAVAGGGFRHDEADAAGPYLGDTLAMGQAFLALYSATADREWLEKAAAASRFLARTFGRDDGFATAARASGPLAPQPPQRDENAGVARFENLLFRMTGDASHRALAERAMRFLSKPEVAQRRPVAVVMLVERELAADPPHVTVVGPKSSDAARALFRAALRSPRSYGRIEWRDPKEGPLPNADTELPVLAEPAAFFCGAGRCSSPLKSPAELTRRLRS